MAEEDRGNWTGSREAFRRLVILRPNFTAAWLGYARNSARLGERSLAQRAVARALVLEPGSADAQAMARALAPAPATPDAAH
jgi:hypothetical protein